LHKDGSINRKKLGDIVFSDNSKLNILNQITHVIVAEKISSQLKELRNENKKLVVVEAIVPIEHGFLDLVDTVWVVLASEHIRIERIIKRNGTTFSKAKQRIRSQMSDAMYKSIADKVIYNNGNIAELEEKVWEALKNEDYSISR
ncbi:MAG: dephospho-CoA kinase, partial [Ruminiclostridium sp.]|nr:dephospho-CoA kinase [Ruminiclostridium sp.]